MGQFHFCFAFIYTFFQLRRELVETSCDHPDRKITESKKIKKEIKYNTHYFWQLYFIFSDNTPQFLFEKIS